MHPGLLIACLIAACFIGWLIWQVLRPLARDNDGFDDPTNSLIQPDCTAAARGDFDGMNINHDHPTIRNGSQYHA